MNFYEYGLVKLAVFDPRSRIYLQNPSGGTDIGLSSRSLMDKNVSQSIQAAGADFANTRGLNPNPRFGRAALGTAKGVARGVLRQAPIVGSVATGLGAIGAYNAASDPKAGAYDAAMYIANTAPTHNERMLNGRGVAGLWDYDDDYADARHYASTQDGAIIGSQDSLDKIIKGINERKGLSGTGQKPVAGNDQTRPSAQAAAGAPSQVARPLGQGNTPKLQLGRHGDSPQEPSRLKINAPTNDAFTLPNGTGVSVLPGTPGRSAAGNRNARRPSRSAAGGQEAISKALSLARVSALDGRNYHVAPLQQAQQAQQAQPAQPKPAARQAPYRPAGAWVGGAPSPEIAAAEKAGRGIFDPRHNILSSNR